MVKQFK